MSLNILLRLSRLLEFTTLNITCVSSCSLLQLCRSCTVSDIYVQKLPNNGMTLKCGLDVIRWHFSIDRMRIPIDFPYQLSLCCIVSKIQRDIGRKSLFFVLFIQPGQKQLLIFSRSFFLTTEPDPCISPGVCRLGAAHALIDRQSDMRTDRQTEKRCQ